MTSGYFLRKKTLLQSTSYKQYHNTCWKPGQQVWCAYHIRVRFLFSFWIFSFFAFIFLQKMKNRLPFILNTSWNILQMTTLANEYLQLLETRKHRLSLKKFCIETSPKRSKLPAQNLSMKSAWSILINLRDINIVQVNYVWIMDFAFFPSHTHY